MSSLLLAAALLTVMPEPVQYADTESVTNIAINVNVERLDRLRILLDFEATEKSPTDSAEDADGGER